jgi:protein-S-isoprenylcysteine O-methyltransferase Ste14
MLQMPIMFFQVGATAIPTLLIAVAVGIKQGAIYAEIYDRAAGWHKKFALVLLCLVTLSIVLGETAALRAIARGSGNGMEIELVWTAIMVCLLLIALEMVQPLSAKMTEEGGHRLLLTVAGAWMVMGAYSALIIYGVLPL